METQINWLDILIQCKKNIKDQIAPFLTAPGRSQPELGIGAGGDPIKQVDLVAEREITKTLREHNISFTLISEETGVQEHGPTPHRNFITADPIDGTTNLIRGIPFYATSIAVSTQSTIETIHTALVADLVHDITYTAQRGKDAQRNGRKITTSQTELLEKAVLGVDLNTYKVHKIAPRITNLIQETKHIRHLGANALELCYVADATIDGFIDIRGKLRATDVAAAWLIIEEAGGTLTTPEGRKLDTDLNPQQKAAFIAAANQKIHRKIISLLELERDH